MRRCISTAPNSRRILSRASSPSIKSGIVSKRRRRNIDHWPNSCYSKKTPKSSSSLSLVPEHLRIANGFGPGKPRLPRRQNNVSRNLRLGLDKRLVSLGTTVPNARTGGAATAFPRVSRLNRGAISLPILRAMSRRPTTPRARHLARPSYARPGETMPGRAMQMAMDRRD